jgi:hypothetical protein
MSDIPGDVWPCAQIISYKRDGGVQPYVATFLIRAPTVAEAVGKASAIAAHDCERTGGVEWSVFCHKESGEAAVGSINDLPLFDNTDPPTIVEPSPAGPPHPAGG